MSLVIIVKDRTNELRAKELGDNFVRMMKGFGPDQPPGKEIGNGVFDHQIGVYHLGQTLMVKGWKLSSRSRISW